MAFSPRRIVPETQGNTNSNYLKISASQYALITLVLLSVSLQLGDLPFLRGALEDRGTYIFIGLYMLLSGIYFLAGGRLKLHRDALIILILFLLADLLGVARFLFDPAKIKDGYGNNYLSSLILFLATKGYFLLTVNTFVEKLNGRQMAKVLRIYLYTFVVSNFVAFLMLKLGLLVLEDVNQNRFAAFHDELVYYNYSAFVSMILLCRGKWTDSFATMGGLYLLYKSTKSNVLPIFILSYLGSWLTMRLHYLQRKLYLIIPIAVLCAIVGIHNFQNWVVAIVNTPWMNFISSFFPRTNFSIQTMTTRYLSGHGGDPVLVRVLLYQGGIDYFLDHLTSLPPGFGGAIFDASYIARRAWKILPTAAGFTAFMADGLLFIFPIIMILLRYLYILSKTRIISLLQRKSFIILSLSITTLAIHGGYLNLPIWTMIFLCYRLLVLEEATSTR